MAKRKLTTNLALFALAVGVLVAIQSFTGSGLIPVVDAVPPPGGGSGCEGDEKIEGAGGSYEAESIASVCIKAGRGVFSFDCGVTDPTGCYDLTWTEGDGCCTAVTIGGGGTSNTCKSISHTAAIFDGEPCDGCVPEPEICDNGIDDDCDGLIDCADGVDCKEDPACLPCGPEICDNGIDDDCDGLIDCADGVDCKEDPACLPCGPEICDNGIDDDCDGLIDCADGVDCKEDPACLP